MKRETGQPMSEGECFVLTNDGSTTDSQEMGEVVLLGKVDSILPPVLHQRARGE